MHCLTADRLYTLLDGDLSSSEKTEIDRHLSACETCRSALAARKRIAEAAAGLPPFEVPADFAAGIMARIPVSPARAGSLFRGWRIALAAGAATVALGFGLTALFSGRGVSALLQAAAAAFGGYLHDAANLFGKGLKVLLLAGKIVGEIAGQVLATLRTVAGSVGPETQAVLAGGSLAILITGALFLRRRIALSERTHEN
jgi:predicted anti-sigma-YlaC factor YlaD